ncbi:MAG: permease [Proteobacteria bacterium]|jgi:hypothetical protein|nr:permease [Pseudomonadota bacterium]
MLDAITAIALAAFALIAQMGPYLLPGLAAAGVLHVILPFGAVARHLGGRGPLPVLKAVALGVPLPICSCGVLPLAASLKSSGARNGATIGFLVTTPTTGVDSILATYSLMGGAFTALRVAATVVLGLIAGFGTALVSHSEAVAAVPPAPGEVLRGFGGHAAGALRYAVVELFGGIARPLAFGIALGGLITYALPGDLLESTIGHGFLSYAAMAAIGIPLYVCASGSIPLAVALLAKGLSPGAALVFLIAGPATNVAAVTVIGKMMGRRTLAVYLATLVAGSVAAGYAADALFAAFPALVPAAALQGGHLHAAEGLGPFEIAAGIASLGLIAYHLLVPLARRLRSRAPAAAGAGAVALRVPDMSCDHCVRTITGALEKVDGVRLVSADPGSKLVTIEADSKEAVARAAAAIRKAGFNPED